MIPPRLGVVMLDTRFPRPLGDAGNPATWSVGTEQRVVPGAWPERVVQSRASLLGSGLAPAFVAAVTELAGRPGVAAITTSCGFLVLLQDELQAAVHVPVVTSALLLLPDALRAEGQVGVLTISADRLGAEHLLAAGVPAGRLSDVVVQGVDPESEFARAILGNRPEMDMEQAASDVVAAAAVLRQSAPQLRTLVLECTNMPPYAGAIGAETGLRVLSLADSPVLQQALRPDGRMNAVPRTPSP